MNTNLILRPELQGLAPSSTLFVNEAVNQLWADGKQVFHMGFGESRFDVHPRLQQALATHANKKSYLPARGLPALLEAAAGYYSSKLDQEFDASQIIIGPGSKALIFGLQMALQADVFLPSPSWVSYAPQATLLGRCFKYIPSRVEDDYALDIAALDSLVQASTNPCKMLILNSPNNPTGNVQSVSELKAIAEYCRANRIWVLSDEIYFEVCHGEREHVSIASYYPEGTFILGGLSKHFSIGGWRLGVGILPATDDGRKLMGAMVTLASETWSGVASPIQYAAVEAYRLHSDVEQYVSDCRAIHGIRTRFIREALVALGVPCSSANGAFYIMPNFDGWRAGLADKQVYTAKDLARYLLENYSLASLPGSDFGLPEQTLSLRLSTSYLDMETDNRPSEIFSLYRDEIGDKRLMSEKHHPVTHAAIAAFSAFINDLD